MTIEIEGARDEFAEAMADVEPLKSDDKIQKSATATEPTPQQLAAQKNATQEPNPNYLRNFLDDSNQVTPEHQFAWRRDGIQQPVVKLMKKGEYGHNLSLDLHHKSIAEAWGLIWTFIEEALDAGIKNVRIVHGLGSKSKTPARMKSYVGQALKDHKEVKGYCSAPSESGGLGATLVWLKGSEADRAKTRERIQSRLG